MQEIYKWVENIAFYSVLLVLVVHVLPAGEQKKYVQFFMGLVFMLLVFSPILRWTGQEEQVTAYFLRASYDQEVEEFLKEQKRLEKNMEDYTWEALQEAAKEEELQNNLEIESDTGESGEIGYEGEENQGREKERSGSNEREAAGPAEGESRTGKYFVEPVEIQVDASKGNAS